MPTLTESLSSCFSGPVQSRGHRYFNEERVELKRYSESAALAEVHGSRVTPYKVALDWSGNGLP